MIVLASQNMRKGEQLSIAGQSANLYSYKSSWSVSGNWEETFLKIQLSHLNHIPLRIWHPVTEIILNNVHCWSIDNNQIGNNLNALQEKNEWWKYGPLKTMKFYSAVKKRAHHEFADKWMELERMLCVKQSKFTQ